MKYFALVVVSLLALSLISSCLKDDPKSNEVKENLKVKLQLSQIYDGLEIKNPNLNLTVTGHFPNPTILPGEIVSENLTINSLPYTILLELPSEPWLLVDPDVKKDHISYYVNILWDSDSNGKICANDIYASTGWWVPTRSPMIDPFDTSTQIIFMGIRSKNQEPCEFIICEDGCVDLHLNFTKTGILSYVNPQMELFIYAYDIHVADAEATLIAYQSYEVNDLPFHVKIKIPENYPEIVFNDLGFPDGSPDENEYHLYPVIKWDSDGNDILNEKDFRVDSFTDIIYNPSDTFKVILSN